MKFKNPKTGEVFDSIHQARQHYCTYDYTACPKSCALEKSNHNGCIICTEEWVESHQAECARLMGYEIIDDEAPVYLPYICRRLDVKPDQPFCIDGYDKHVCFRIQSDGTFCTIPPMQKGSCAALLYAIEHPERVMPFWSKQEIADAQTLLRMFPTSHVEITHNASGTIVTCRNLMHGEIQRILLADLFPSLQFGQTVDASDIAARGQ